MGKNMFMAQYFFHQKLKISLQLKEVKCLQDPKGIQDFRTFKWNLLTQNYISPDIIYLSSRSRAVLDAFSPNLER